MMNINYLHVDEKSHYWTDINQILEWLKYPMSFDVLYLQEGLNNTLKNGYNISKMIPVEDIKECSEPTQEGIQLELFTTTTYPEGTTFTYTNG